MLVKSMVFIVLLVKYVVFAMLIILLTISCSMALTKTEESILERKVNQYCKVNQYVSSVTEYNDLCLEALKTKSLNDLYKQMYILNNRR